MVADLHTNKNVLPVATLECLAISAVHIGSHGYRHIK